MEGNFIEWLIEKRLDWLASGKLILSEEELSRELVCAFSQDGEMNDSIRTALGLLVNQIMHDRQAAYHQGILDGIRLMKEIFNQ